MGVRIREAKFQPNISFRGATKAGAISRTQRSIAEAVAKLEALPRTEFTKQKKRATVAPAAKILRDKMVFNAPILAKRHSNVGRGRETSRIDTRTKRKKDRVYRYRYKRGQTPPGSVNKPVAEYTRRNLKRSIKIFTFPKSAGKWVGARVPPKRSPEAKGVFDSVGRADGYYAFFLEYGTKWQMPNPFIRRSGKQARGAMYQAITKEVDKRIQVYLAKNRIRRAV